MTVGELKRALALVADAYAVHLEGQEVGSIELCERTKAIFK
jgi:hypothetical protein